MQYKQNIDILNSENVKGSLSTVKRIGQHSTKTGSSTRKIDSGCPKFTMKKKEPTNNIGCSERENLRNLAKEFKTYGQMIWKNYVKKSQREWNPVKNIYPKQQISDWIS